MLGSYIKKSECGETKSRFTMFALVYHENESSSTIYPNCK